MNRELIFRQWDKKHERFYYWGINIDYDGRDTRLSKETNSFASPSNINHQSEQYTGLVDSERKRIFEGDIIRIFESAFDDTKYWDGKVYYSRADWYVDEINGNEDFEGWFLTDCLFCEGENVQVIGNIHEGVRE